jgi:hypothetical protein
MVARQWKRRRRAGRVGAAALGAAAALGMTAGAAGAGSTERADFGLGLTSQRPGTATGMTLHIRYKARGGNPNAKPSPIRAGKIEAPTGTSFHLGAVPACHASDDELRADGRSACPRASLVGHGSLSVFTGFGPPIDPYSTDAWLYNTGPGKGFVEVVQQKDQDVTLGFDRPIVRGSTITLHPPVTPGGPPDGESAVRDIDFLFNDPTYMSTPPSCPRDRLWRSRGTFTFADGVTTRVGATTPCARSARRRGRAARPRMRLKITPRRARVGRRVRFRVRVRGARRCIRRATVRFARHRVRTNSRGRARIVARLRRHRRYKAVAAKRGCRPARAWVRGRRTRKSNAR